MTSHAAGPEPDPVPGQPSGTQRSPLARREFRLFFAGNMISNTGTWLQNVALAVYMHQLTGSSFWVGLAGSALFVPVLLFALPAGVLADRVDRLGLLLRSQVAAAGLAAALTVLVAFEVADRYTVVAIAAGLGTCLAVAIPAMLALTPALVPRRELAHAIGLNALTFSVGRVGGPVLAAATLTFLGAVWAFGLNALSFLALILALLLIGQPPYAEPPGRPGPMREAIGYAWRHRRTRMMLLAITAVGVSMDPIITLSPALAESHGHTAATAGWIVSAWGAGAVIAIAAGRRTIASVTERGLGWVGLLAITAGVAGLGASRSLAEATLAGLVIGAGYITSTIAFTSTIQADVPDRLRGRVSAIWTVAFLGTRTFAAVADGALADAIGPHRGAAAFALPALLAAWVVRRTLPPPAESPATPPA